MTILARYHEAYSIFNSLLFAVNKYTKRGKDVPTTLLAQFGAAYEAYQAALAEMRANV